MVSADVSMQQKAGAARWAPPAFELIRERDQ